MIPRGHTRLSLADGEATWLIELLSLSLGNKAHDATRCRLHTRLTRARKRARNKLKPVIEE